MMSKNWAFHFGLLTSIRNGHLSRLNNEPKLSCCIGLSRSLACNHQRVRDIIFLSCLRRSEAVASVHARPVVIVAAASDLESLPPSFFSQLSLLGYTEGPRKKKQQDARTRKKFERIGKMNEMLLQEMRLTRLMEMTVTMLMAMMVKVTMLK